MRKKIVAGNWKMNMLYAEAMALVDGITDRLDDKGECEVILAPPFIYLHEILARVQRVSQIALAAQNCSDQPKGAFTGEVGAAMLASVGAEFVLVGHSERRARYGETDELLAAKVNRVVESSLLPIFCCGETLDQRNAGRHFDTVKSQLEKGLFHLDSLKISDCVIAYEPVWAIGTGVTASAAQAQEMHACIRDLIRTKYGDQISSRLPIVYGGSVTSKNASELFAAPDVDGGLVGGASLKVDEFLQIIAAMNKQINKS